MSRRDDERTPALYRCGTCLRAAGLSRANVLLPHQPQTAAQAGPDGKCLGTGTLPRGPVVSEAGPS